MARGELSRAGGFMDGFNQAYDTFARVMTDAQLRKIADAKPEQFSQYSPEQAAQLDAAAKATDAEGKPLYDISSDGSGYTLRGTAGGDAGTMTPGLTRTMFLGKTSDKPLSASDEMLARSNAMADAVAATDPFKAQQLRQSGLQTQAAGIQVDNAKRDQDWRTKTADTVAEFEKGLTGDSGTPRTPTQSESYDLAVKLAGVNQAYGHGAIFDRADALDRAKKIKDENALEALRFAHAGDKENAMKRFNEFGDTKITDMNLTPTTMDVGGIKVPTYAISGTKADGTPFNIPSAYGALIRGLSFEQVAKGEELGLKRISTDADVTKANAAMKSAGADVSRAATAQEVADQGKRAFVQGEAGGGVVDMGKPGSEPTYTPLSGVPGKVQGDKRLSEVKEARSQLETGLGITRDPMGQMISQGGADMGIYNDVTAAMDSAIRNGMSASQAGQLGRQVHDTAVKLKAAGSPNPVADAIARLGGRAPAGAAVPGRNRPSDYSTLWK